METRLPDLYALSPQQIQQLIDDLRLVIDDNQAALFEVFYRQRLLLLSEYETEMQGKLRHYEKTTEPLSNKSEMVDRLIQEGELIWQDIPEDEAQAQAEFLRENF